MVVLPSEESTGNYWTLAFEKFETPAQTAFLQFRIRKAPGFGDGLCCACYSSSPPPFLP